MKNTSTTKENKVHSGWWGISGRKEQKEKGRLDLPTERIIKLGLHRNLS
jgi:hypothetical protein